MYSIIGADEKEYGPAELETLIQWARDGRVIERTAILDHSTGRRFLACDLQPLTIVFGRTSVVAPPVQQPRSSAPPVQISVDVRQRPRRSRTVAGLLGIFFGWLGIHRYYLGYSGVGTIMLLLTLITCFMASPLTVLWGFIEGILCLVGAMSDADGAPLGP